MSIFNISNSIKIICTVDLIPDAEFKFFYLVKI